MSAADAEWKKRKLEILNKIEQFQKLGWTCTGFVACNNADELRRRLYYHNQKYCASLLGQNSYSSQKEPTVPMRMSPHDYRPTVIPPIPSSSVLPVKSASKSDRWKDCTRVNDSRTFTISPINFMDVVQESATKVEYIRKYVNKEGEVVVKNEKIYKRAKIGSLKNVDHNPTPSQVRILSKPLPSLKVKSKIGSLDNVNHQPRRGKRKIYSERLNWNSKSKVGSLENMGHQPSGGHNLIFQKRLQWDASPKVGSLENIGHTPTRSFRTASDSLPNYSSPIRRKLLEEGDKVIWTEGSDQHAIANPKSIDSTPRYKTINSQAKLGSNGD